MRINRYAYSTSYAFTLMDPSDPRSLYGMTGKAHPNRRQMLLMMMAGGLGATAGCLGDDEVADIDLEEVDPTEFDDIGAQLEEDPVDVPEDLADTFVSGQEFVIPSGVEPGTVHFIYGPGTWTEFNIDTMYQHGSWGDVQSLVVDMPMWGPWMEGGMVPTTDESIANSAFILYEDMEIQPEYARIKIRDDARWSDGEHVTAEDAVRLASLWIEPHDEYGYEPPPAEAPIMKYFRYNMPDGPDGKVFEYFPPDTPDWENLEPGEGLQDPYRLHAYWLTTWFPRYAPYVPTHVEPFKSLTDHHLEQWDERDPDKQTIADTAGQQGYLTDEVLAESRESPPPYHGAWAVDRIEGDEGILLKPNEYYYAADRINFDAVFAEYSPDAARDIATLMAGHVDFSAASVAADVVEEVPDKYDVFRSPAGGTSMAWTHYPDSPFHHVKVRQATAFAVDTEAVAENAHPLEHVGVTRPGWDVWNAELWMDEDWAMENLTDYSQDIDRAEELMLEAGAERDNDDVWIVDGQRMEFELATASDNPVIELTVQDQLRQFGIDLELRMVDDAEYVDRVRGDDSREFIEEEFAGVGDFYTWMGDYGQNQFAGDISGLFDGWHNTHNGTRRIRQHGMYDHEQIEELAIDIPAGGSMEGHWHRDFHVEIPPMGEPDGELHEFPVVYLARMIRQFHPRDLPLDELIDYELYDPPHPGEHHDENEQYHLHFLAWTNNWYLPTGLPLTNDASQLFLNSENWIWLPDLPDAPDPLQNHFMQFMNNTFAQLGSGFLQANPDNPKDGAEVVER